MDLLDDSLRCELCPSRKLPRDQKKKVVLGEGNRNARVFLVGEAPGAHEARVGRPFIGKTGAEVDGLWLPTAGLSRQDCWVSNSVCCHWADSSDAPPDWLVKSCSQFHLKAELEKVRPEVVVLMGGIACSLCGIDVDLKHGIGQVGVSVVGHEPEFVWPSYHPAIAFHRSSTMQALLEDFKSLRGWLSGDAKPLVDAIPNPAFYRLQDPDDVDAVMDGLYDEPVAVDTESEKTWTGFRSSIRYIPWSVQWCSIPGEAYMLKVDNKPAMARFAHHIVKSRKVIMHNAPFDQEILRRLDIHVPWGRVVDSMSMAYGLANLPKGLKPLSYRLLGVTAPSFEDVTKPHAVKAAIEYFEEAAKMDWPEPEQVVVGGTEVKKCKECKGMGVVGVGRGKMRKEYECEACESGFVYGPKISRRQGIGKKIGRLLGDLTKNPGMIDPVARWEAWGDDVKPLVDKLGPLPLPSVALVPDDKIDFYAMLDAHSTKRIYGILKSRMIQMRKGDYAQA